MRQISACTLDCPGCCSLLLTRGRRGEERLTGNPDHPYTRGAICRKGRHALERLRSPERLTTPLIRTNGEFRPASWSEALALCASRIDALRATPERMLHVRGFGYRGVLANASRHIFRTLGAAETSGSLCDATGLEASLRDFGGNEHNAPEDLYNAAAIINWGKDLSRSSFHLARMVQECRKSGCPVLSISPGGDATQSLSDASIRIRPGTDRFLAAAALKHLFDTDAIPERARNACADLQKLRALLTKLDTAALLAACDTTPDDLSTLVRWLRPAGDAPVSILLGWGLQRHVLGGENVRWINALGMLSGNVGRAGACVQYGFSSSRNLANAWGTRSGEPPRTVSLPRFAHDLEQADPPYELVWVDGSNIVNQVPDARRAAAAFENCAFTVVSDAFLTDTARRAHVVLPCALLLEREDIVGSFQHNYVQYAAPILRAPGEAREDFDIMAELARRLTPPLDFPSREKLLQRAVDTPFIKATLEEIKSTGFSTASRPGIAWQDMRFGHEDGLFHPVQELTPEPENVAGDPLKLLTVVRTEYLHSQMPEAVQQGLPTAWIAPDCRELQKLDMSRTVRIVSPSGTLDVRIVLREGLHPEAIMVERGGWLAHGWNPNVLIGDTLTDMGEGAAYYSQSVRLENA